MDELLSYYKDSNGTKSKHTMKAMETSMKRLAKVVDKSVDDLSVSDFKKSEVVIDKLVSDYSLSTVISSVLSIITFLKFKEASENLIADYKDVLNELVNERNKNDKDQTMTEHEEDNWIEYPELKKQIESKAEDFLNNKKAFTAYRNFLLMALLTLQPPTRLGNYLDMKYKNLSSLKNGGKGLKKDRNYILYNNDQENPKYTFIFNKYKTAKTLGQITHHVDSEILNKLLHKWFADYNTKKVDFLVNTNGALTSQTGVSNGLKSISKKIFNKELTGNSFRHIFITDFLSKNPSIEEKESTLRLVGQNYKPTQAEKYAKIKSDD